MSRTSLGWAVFRAIGTAARAFADSVDAEHAEAERPPAAPTATAAPGEAPPEVRTFGKKVTEPDVPCIYCSAPSKPAPASGKGWRRCERNHAFHPSQQPTPAQ